MEIQKFSYDNKIVKAFLYATMGWGIVAFLVGVIAASLLFAPTWIEKIIGTNIGELSFGRLRPLHTNTAIFAFVLNSVFAGVFYSLQRLLKTRMYSDKLSWILFWGWQLMIILGGITLLSGLTTSKEYAELEWPLDILITVLWLVFGFNMFLTIAKRRVRHLYVAIWFYLGTWFAVAILHIFNSMAIPVTFLKSYSAYAGVQDAIIQWWYGHNAVAFVLTTPILGLMYYFIPKASNRPVFSYKLSIIHFWSLIFIYIWAGPHHLIYTALPNWTQVVGTGFSIMLIAPSWGGMLNGLLTLRGAWDKVREDATLKFFVVALTCYGMATFEGPLLATKTLNTIGHFTDWVIGHVHVGTLGWNGFMAFGMMYYLVPKLWRTQLYSKSLANTHFWIGTIGIILYAVSMYTSGITQALMWKEYNPDGSLANPNFLKTVTAIIPMYFIRFVGGILYLSGAVVMVYNFSKTIKKGSLLNNEPVEAPALRPVKGRMKGEGFHLWLERKPILMTVLAVITVSIGGLVEIIPNFAIEENIPTISSVKPLTPLELEGRDIYIRESCNACHTQMIRPFRDEVDRYGEYSKAGEFVYDHPFLWGSRRTGPDLAREGLIKSDAAWHFRHMKNPRSTSPGSIMPSYPWLIVKDLKDGNLKSKMKGLRKVGVPYTDEQIATAYDSLAAQAKRIEAEIYTKLPDAKELYKSQNQSLHKKEIAALIAYLKRLGTDISKTEE